MVAFVGSIVVLIVGVGACMAYARRRPVDAPMTWGEAMVGSTFVFFLIFWAYGVVPHQWLNWADSELNWRADSLGIPSHPWSDHVWFSEGITFFGRGRIAISLQTLRDLIATGIYVVLLGFQIWLWSWWQKRGDTKPEELPTSAYGRPLLRAGEGGDR